MLEKYATYGFEDFIQDERFILWVKFPDRESNLFWSGFLTAFPFQEETIEQAKQIVLKLKDASYTGVSDEDATEIWNNIQFSIEKTEKIVPLWKCRWTKSLAAAIILLIGGFAIWQIKNPEANLAVVSNEALKVMSGDLTEIPNNSVGSLTVKLPDNSRVTLESGARLRYKTNFAGPVREVYLTGEAFFEVSRNVKKPFIIYTHKLITKVLGTSFRIKANEKNTTVAVKTGKVFVFTRYKPASPDQPTGLVLRPNQQADLENSSEALSLKLVEEPLPISPAEESQNFAFDNIPVAEIFTTVGKSYGIEILFDKNILTGCRLTTSFKKESLFERLDVLCEAINATYKVEDARIIINGKRCL